MDFNIIKKTTGEASEYASYLIELYQKKNGKTEQVEDALNLFSKDAVLLKGNKNSHKILLCSKTDPYPPDYEGNTVTREAIRILDQNGLKYVILTENAMRAIDDFKQLKHPENTNLIIKIESIPHDKKNENQADEDFMNLLFSPIHSASEKGVRIGIHFGPGSNPVLSLQLIHKLYRDVDLWKLGKFEFEPKAASKKEWKKFKEEAGAKLLFNTLSKLFVPRKYKIKDIDGNPRLLLIAPHGVASYPKDDINTDKLAIKIAERLKCRAIVNDVISRLYLDLNKVNEASKHKQFISAIESAVKISGPTLVVWIHGIGDDNLKTEIQELGVKGGIQCLLGYGCGQPNRLTAEEKTVKDIIRFFKDNSIIAHVARNESNYCGHNIFYEPMDQVKRI